ncbi:hypothetical protein [Mesorhizobium sp. M0814]|uniref:hypothetical protein n=1 Tax=unclassified Mesorhizobium TaxID=325217 RepID=UPI00333B13B9
MIQHLGRPVTFMAAILALSTAAEAEPVTYAGKLGKSDIVVEFTGDPATADGPLAGRYFYRSKGVDIPLQAKLQKGSKFELAEEEACGADNCDDGNAAPIAAVWRLASSSNGKTLEGSWNGKRALPLRLERVASRQGTGNEPSTPLDLYDFSFMNFFGNDTPLTMETSPYDYLRMDTQLDNGKTTGWPDATYRYVVDPRTKFATPRIVELSGNVPIEAANALLQDRHWRANIGALGCVAAQYAGFNEGGPIDGVNDGTLGGYEDSTFEVTSLTPRLMSWRESGSIFCGGAHPTNYSDAYIMDVRGGVLLGLQDIFLDTVDGKPGPSLASLVKQRRKKPIDQTDIDHEAECGMDDLIGEYLAVSLWREGDKQVLVFGLQTLPHAIQACADDLLELPVSEARDLFKPAFARLVEP